MGSIIKKKIKGITYYYYVESKRIDGKSRLVNQKYLGSAEKLLKMASDSGKSLQEKVLYADEINFGAAALLYDFGMRLGIVDAIDEVVPKRKQGVSVGLYILTAAINRAVCPTSTSGLKDWYGKTPLPFITGHKPSAFSPQNFWNNTCITAEQLGRCEDAITKKCIAEFDIDMKHLIYDATNFFTYIDTMNPATLAKRGHDKAKRNDLKTVGLSLIVTPDFSIPLFSAAYPGNRNDSAQFAGMMESLKSRYSSVTGKEADVTVVFDRGNNSEGNLELLDSTDGTFHYIGGLKKNQVPELFSVKKSEYTRLECPENAPPKYRKLTVHRMKAEAYGREMTMVIVHNPELEKGQLQGIDINTARTKQELLALQERLLKRASGEIRKGRKPTAASVEKAAGKILNAREYMEDIFSYEVIEKGGHVYLTFAESDEKKKSITEAELGKTALFTDRDDLTDYEIISAYRSAWHVESSFKQMKNTDFLTVRPIFHWTDEKIAVHIFICVLAYKICCLLRKELNEKGIACSINSLISSMNTVNRVTTFYGELTKPKKLEAFTRGDGLAQQIESIYQLQTKYYG